MCYSIDFHKQTIKNDVPLATVTKLKTLPCQQICDFKIQKSLDIPETFTVESELLVNDQKVNDQKSHKHEFIEFIMSCIRNTR